MKKVLSILLIAVLLCTTLTACGEKALVGTWVTAIGGDEGEMLLRRDGTGTITSNGETRPCTWKVEDDTLTVVQNVGGLQYVFLDEVTYSVRWKTLTVTDPETGNTLEFEKK